MRNRAIATLSAVLLFTVVGCGTDEESDKPAPSKSSTSAGEAAGIPPEPTGEVRERYLESLRTISPALVADEEKAIDAGRNQCSSIKGGGKDIEGSTQQRFSHSGHEVTAAEATAIVTVLKTTLCP